MSKEQNLNNAETQQLNITDVRRRFRNIIIDALMFGVKGACL